MTDRPASLCETFQRTAAANAGAIALRSAGGELSVCALNQTVAEVFDISGIGSLLPIYASVEEALGSP